MDTVQGNMGRRKYPVFAVSQSNGLSSESIYCMMLGWKHAVPKVWLNQMKVPHLRHIFQLLIGIAQCLLACLPLQAELYFVSPDGSDLAAGSESAPWATLHHAATIALAGDVVYVRGGTYRPEQAVEFAHDGEPENWITFAAYPGERPIFDFVNYPLEPQWESAPFPHDLGAILVRYREYIRLDGLEVRNSRKMGINVRDSRNIEVLNCVVDNTFSCGIGVWNSAFVRIIGNKISRSNQRNLRSYGDFNKAPPHEALSFGGGTDFEVAYNHVFNGGKRVGG